MKSKSVVILGLDSSLRGVLEEDFKKKKCCLLMLNIMVICRSDHELFTQAKFKLT